MSQKIIKVGSSIALTIPKRLAQKLGLQAGDSIVVDEKNKRLVVSPIPKKETQKKVLEHDKKIATLTKNFIDKYRSDLDALAK